jgi:hypothetical protein
MFAPTLGSNISVGAGINLTSLNISSLDLDRLGQSRRAIGAWDIGAYAYSTALSIKKGDVNNDDVVNMNDAVLTTEYLAGQSNPSFNLTNAEVDGQNTVDIYDVFLIAEYAVGEITKF